MKEQIIESEYKTWLHELKLQIKRTQVKASISVNSQLIMLYWDIGRQIVEKQEKAKWGSKLLEQLSNDLRKEFPEMGGFSRANMFNIKKFYLFYSPFVDDYINIQQVVGQFDLNGTEKVQQAVGQLEQRNIKSLPPVRTLPINNFLMIPWGHHVKILERVKDIDQAVFYINKTIENNWSRTVLEVQIDTNLFKRLGKAKTNFVNTLPEPDSDLAIEMMKSDYNFEFLQVSEKTKELDVEKALIQHIQDFLTEMGKGFAFLGRQYPITVGDKEFRIDLLFYHVHLKCYIVVELKTKEFEPDHLGKLLFYVNAVNKYVKDDRDGATIGILLCKDKNDEIVDVALDGINRPMGVSKIQFTELSEEAKAILPSPEELQLELEKFNDK